MKLEDAKECTFTPMIGCRAPDYIKRYLKESKVEYGQEILEILFSKKPNFEKWIENMGICFRDRYPRIYRFGIYKRLLRILKDYNYKKAFQIVQENFNLQ